jgi:thiol:disulfide interchange protein
VNLKTLFSVLLAISLAFAAKEKFGFSYKDAINGNKKNGKPILIEFYADWCIPCLEMEKTVFKDSEVLKELNRNFYFVRLDTEKDEEIFCEGETNSILNCMALWDIDGIPAFAVLDGNGKLSHITVGDFTKKTFLFFLKAVKVNLHLK